MSLVFFKPSGRCVGAMGCDPSCKANASRLRPSGLLIFGAFDFAGASASKGRAAAGRDTPMMSLMSAIWSPITSPKLTPHKSTQKTKVWVANR